METVIVQEPQAPGAESAEMTAGMRKGQPVFTMRQRLAPCLKDSFATRSSI